jgi:hypothetical protein
LTLQVESTGKYDCGSIRPWYIESGNKIRKTFAEENWRTRKKLKNRRRSVSGSTHRSFSKYPRAAKQSGYPGKSDAFDRAIGEFALLYADQTDRLRGR